jgi:hypothetical protein
MDEAVPIACRATGRCRASSCAEAENEVACGVVDSGAQMDVVEATHRVT